MRTETFLMGRAHVHGRALRRCVGRVLCWLRNGNLAMVVHAHAGRHEGLHHVHLSGADCAAPGVVLRHYLELAPSTLVTWTPVAQPHPPLMPKANLLRGATSAAVRRHHHYPRRITGAYWQASRHQRGRPSMVPPWSLAAAARKINLEQALGEPVSEGATQGNSRYSG